MRGKIPNENQRVAWLTPRGTVLAIPMTQAAVGPYRSV